MEVNPAHTMLTLPKDLTNRGFRLLSHEVGYLFAVSERWGCTSTRATLDAVVREARSIISYIEWYERRPVPNAPAVDIFPIDKEGLNDEQVN